MTLDPVPQIMQVYHHDKRSISRTNHPGPTAISSNAWWWDESFAARLPLSHCLNARLRIVVPASKRAPRICNKGGFPAKVAAQAAFVDRLGTKHDDNCTSTTLPEGTASTPHFRAPQLPKHPHRMPKGRFRFRKHSAHNPSKHQDYILSAHNTNMSRFLPHAPYAEDQRYPRVGAFADNVIPPAEAPVAASSPAIRRHGNGGGNGTYGAGADGAHVWERGD
ncbi:hypothetical protein V492_02679 [Pseudogymnoascus sp. VKM F-4246]|nr:hypothetical protein V492_02679 [Pseudogymnoascus sp. VKM F-4246]